MISGREQEIDALAAHYGEPLRHVAALQDSNFSPMTKDDRMGEVCMVVRRTSGHLLTARKVYYPPGISRLLTGGVGYGESIESALLRETYEETGLQVAVRRFLAIVSYRLAAADEPLGFATFAFLLAETGGRLAPQDESEQISDFCPVLPADLPTLAAKLAALPDQYEAEFLSTWRVWGQFRAATHRAVSTALQNNP